MRRVDKLGRIVIPLELREKYGLTEGMTIEFIDAGDGITVKSSQAFCKLCRSIIENDTELYLCESCAEKIVRIYGKK